MPVVLLLAAIVILAGVVVVAMGRGGELALPRPDSAAFGRELVTPADMARFRPPAALLGYSAQVTDDALRRIARAVAERDAELAMLRRELAVLRARESRAGGPAYSDPGSYADPSAYADTGTYTDLSTYPPRATSAAPAGLEVSPGESADYGSALSFSASRADGAGALEPYESELAAAGPADRDGSGGPRAGRDLGAGAEEGQPASRPDETEPGS